MYKINTLIFCLCFCLFSYVYSETYLSDFFETNPIESLEKESFPLDKELLNKYQAVANQFKTKGTTKTNVVTYETLSTGVHVHVGWYVDGAIVTALDGTEAGKQVVFINGYIVGISYDIKFYNGYFVHNYTWATVTSYTNNQILKTK